jgi:hypothetical protein
MLGCLLGGLMSLSADAAEIALIPISADGVNVIDGDEITLLGGGQRVFLEIFVSDWDPEVLKVYQAAIQSTGYSSGSLGTIDPATEACTVNADCVATFGNGATCGYVGHANECTPGFIDNTRADYVFACCQDLPFVDVSTLDYRFGSTLVFDTLADPGVAKYAGTLVLDVPVGAVGTFTVGFKPLPDSFMKNGSFLDILPLNLTPALITISCESNEDCADGNACTSDSCDQDGTCINSPNYDPVTQCCDPATGNTALIDDLNDCTDDVCNEATGQVTHDPSPSGAACGDANSSECDLADTCDGAGNCDSNVQPAGTACGDPTDTECNAPDQCDGAGTCDPNFTSSGTPCGSPSDTDCTDPDTCDGTGTCQANDAEDGTTCDDGLYCNENESCTDGACGGGNALDCDDGTPCTTDTCNEGTDQCDNDLNAGSCLIDDTCYAEGELNPANDCEECNTATSTSDWSFSPAGTLCDDGDACTGTGRPGIGLDECDGAGTCFGTPDPECNDDCEFAIPVTEGVTIGNNDNRGPDDAEASCQPDSNNDVWFVFTPACDGDVFLSTTGSVFVPSNDPVLSVWDECPDGGGAEIACDDDSGLNLNAALVFTGTAGEDYYIRVAGFEDNSGDILLTVEPFDDCLIDGICYAAGALNPENDCEACIPSIATLEWSWRPEGSACGNPVPDDADCDQPDACDGFGICEANPKPDGTDCTDDGNECSFDECLAGACTHPPQPAGTACGDPSDTECDNPDTCDGASVCLDNFEVAGAPCGDPTDEQCDNPDICDGSGACEDNLEDDGFPCDDEDVCTGDDVCDAGVCIGTPIPEAPIVEAVGSRRIRVTPQPPGTPAPVALRVTSPDWTCIDQYISLAGTLDDPAVFQVPDDWGSILVLDEDIVPSSLYEVVAECGIYSSAPGSASTALWGDIVGDFIAGAWTPPDGVVDFNDITATVDGFQHLATAPSEELTDVHPCIPEGVIDFMDIRWIVDAFLGDPYPCAIPCP